MQGAESTSAVTTRTRRCVHLFLLVFAISGVAHLELFPFSGFRLFSELRPAEVVSWQLRAVDRAGRETPIQPRFGTTTLLPKLHDMSPTARDGVCDSWADPLRDRGAAVAVVRVYRVVDDVKPGGSAPRRALVYECGGRA